MTDDAHLTKAIACISPELDNETKAMKIGKTAGGALDPSACTEACVQGPCCGAGCDNPLLEASSGKRINGTALLKTGCR